MKNGAAPVLLWLARAPALAIGDAAPLPLSRKDAALLAVLALDGARARTALAALLWPTRTRERALGSLRQRCFRLARSAGVPVVEGDETLRLAAGVALPSFEQQLADATPAADGELLDGLAFDDSPALEQWLLAARERWRVQRAQALARIASRLEDAGRLADALHCAQRLARDEPLSDHAHRRLMRLHHLRGDLGAALEAYRAFAARLAAELGELPDDETAALAAALRLGTAPVRAATPLPVTLRRPPRLVGRGAAWAALARACDDGASVVVDGVPGIGKSRLLADAAAERARTGTPVVAVEARTPDADRPYAVLARVLGALWFDPGAPCPGRGAALPAWARDELAALLPELGAAPPRVDALRLARAVQFALADAGPALIVIDDVQSADAASLEMLPSLQRDAAPRWWLGVRAGECPPALQAWLEASSAPRRVSLAALSAPEVEQLLDDLALAHMRGPAWGAALARHTGGRPLFVLEILRGLYESGSAAADPALALAAVAPGDSTLQLVRTRLGRLAEAARQLAQTAAVVDTPLSADAAAQLLGGEPAGWFDAFGALEDAQWLDPDGRLHDLVRAAVLHAMPAGERRWRHARVAVWLDAGAAAAVQVARHWRAAGRDELAAPALLRAADEAQRTSRPREEARLREEAAQAWERAGEPAQAFDARRFDLPARVYSDGPIGAEPLVDRLEADAVTPAQRARARAARMHLHAVAGRPDLVLRVGHEALALAEAAADPSALRFAGGDVAIALAEAGRTDDALALIERVRSTLRQVSHAERQGYWSQRSHVLYRCSRLAECARALRSALALARQARDRREACTLMGNLAVVYGDLGRWNDAWRVVRDALALRADLGAVEGGQAAGIDLIAGGALAALGRLGAAIDAFERADAAYARAGVDAGWRNVVERGLAAVHLLRGDADAAEAALRPLSPALPPFRVARRRLLEAAIAHRRGADPEPSLAAAAAVLDGGGDASVQLAVEAESALLRDAPPPVLGALQRRAEAIEQHALALRLAWWRVDALRRNGDRAEAAALVRTLLASAATPSQLLAAHRFAIAQAALAEAGDPEAATCARRAREALRATARDLGGRAGPGPEPRR